MPRPLTLYLNPQDVATGALLLVAAAGAVRRPQGILLAAWNYYHAMQPHSASELAVRDMLNAAAGAIDTTCACFCFKDEPSRHTSGLVPLPTPNRFPPILSRFPRAIEALATAVCTDGAFAVVVSNGRDALPGAESRPVFRPGILRLNPCGDEVAYATEDVFSELGFPTLTITPYAKRDRMSSHERLELCGQLAARMAEDVRATRESAPIARTA